MLSLEELFCSVDDFCQWFEPRWQRQLLQEGLQQRQRARSLFISEVMNSDCLSSICLPELQSILQQESLGRLALSLSWLGQLSTVCRVDSRYPAASVCLLAPMLWQLHWHQLYGLHQRQGLPQPPDCPTPSVQGPSYPW